MFYKKKDFIIVLSYYKEDIEKLKKITIIANKDIRLEMYDILAEKLGLKVADDPIIKRYSGNGM